jgi:hypothetical protein
MCGTVDDYVLADDVVVANDAFGLLTTELEVLGQGGDDTTLMDLVITAHAGTIEDGDKREDDTVVTNHNVNLDIHKREYLAVVADTRLWADFGFWTYFAHCCNLQFNNLQFTIYFSI